MKTLPRGWPVGAVAIAALLFGMGAASAAGSVRYGLSCGASTTTCSPGDYLKISALPEPASDTTAAEQAKTALNGVAIRIVDRDDATRCLPPKEFKPSGSTSPAERLIDLRPLLSGANRNEPTIRAVIYARKVVSVPLQVVILASGDDEHCFPDPKPAVLATLPFSLDMAAAYKDGTVGLILDTEDLVCTQPTYTEGSTTTTTSKQCEFEASLQLPIVNLTQWALAMNKQPTSLTLYLNDIAMTGLRVTPGSALRLEDAAKSRGIAPGTDALRYELRRDLSTAAGRKPWSDLLTAQHGEIIALNVGVGLDSSRWSYAQGGTTLARPKGWPWALLVAALSLGLVWALGAGTETLRASKLLPLTRAAFNTSALKPNIGGTGQRAGMSVSVSIDEAKLLSPHSLSRITMAMWIALVSFGFFLVYWATSNGDLINTTAIALLGFSATSMVFANAIDSATQEDKDLDSKFAAAIKEFGPADVNNGDKIGVLQDCLDEAQGKTLVTTGNFVRDIFGEKASSRLDLHRLQMVLFTIFYMVIFVASLYVEVALPEFSSTVLALLGISTASYLGYKFTASQ